MRPFHIEIVTPDGVAYDGQIESLLIRTADGDVEILRSHADYVAAIETGRARLKVDGKERFAAVNGGFLSVNKGDVKLVTITFEFADQIDKKRAEKAKENAETAIKAARDEHQERLAKAKLARAVSRLNVSELK